jgi:hypothetical protein
MAKKIARMSTSVLLYPCIPLGTGGFFGSNV